MIEGLHNHRTAFPCNEIERRFVEAWRAQQMNYSGALLDSLLDTRHRVDPSEPILTEASDRDKEVAETVIQWLGSSVGLHFLESVIGQSVDRVHARVAPRPWRRSVPFSKCRHPAKYRRKVTDHEKYNAGKISRRGEQCRKCLRYRWEGSSTFESAN